MIKVDEVDLFMEEFKPEGYTIEGSVLEDVLTRYHNFLGFRPEPKEVTQEEIRLVLEGCLSLVDSNYLKDAAQKIKELLDVAGEEPEPEIWEQFMQEMREDPDEDYLSTASISQWVKRFNGWLKEKGLLKGEG